MSVVEKQGSYGAYFGSNFDSSSPCNYEQQKVNALYIYSFLSDEGWTINSIAALLGNMQAESSINPGRWQNDDVGNYNLGYGLVQWTPVSKYTEWVAEEILGDPAEMDNNLLRILYEVRNRIQWYATDEYDLSFEEFTQSTLSPSYLAESFLINYERPADQSDSVKQYRGELADAWYTFLSGEEPIEPEPDPEETTKIKKRRFNFMLFKRRINVWTKKHSYRQFRR